MFKRAFLRGRVLLYRKQGYSAKQARLMAGDAWRMRVEQEATLVAAILPMMDAERQDRIKAEPDQHRQVTLCRVWADDRKDAQNNADKAARALKRLKMDGSMHRHVLKAQDGNKAECARISSRAKMASTSATRNTYGARKDKTRWQGISTADKPAIGRTVKAGTAEKHELAELTARAKRRHTRKPQGGTSWAGLPIRHNVMPDGINYQQDGVERMSDGRKALRKYLEK